MTADINQLRSQIQDAVNKWQDQAFTEYPPEIRDPIINGVRIKSMSDHCQVTWSATLNGTDLIGKIQLMPRTARPDLHVHHFLGRIKYSPHIKEWLGRYEQSTL